MNEQKEVGSEGRPGATSGISTFNGHPFDKQQICFYPLTFRLVLIASFVPGKMSPLTVHS